MTHGRQKLGRYGEAAAARRYEADGYTVVERNLRVGRDEIDLICVSDRLVAFVEVKTRSTDRYGGGAVAVGARKQAKIRGVALAWLASVDGGFDEIRFDVAVVDPAGLVTLWLAAF